MAAAKSAAREARRHLNIDEDGDDWPASTAEVQWALARAGASATVEDGGDGGARVTDVSDKGTSDLVRIAAAFADLRDQGFVAEGALGETSSEGWDEVATMADDSEAPAVFWNIQSHDVFDTRGNLGDKLALQWSGDADAIVAALQAHGLDVVAPASARDTIVVRPGNAGAGDSDEGDSEEGDDDVDTFHGVMDEAEGWSLEVGQWGVQYERDSGSGRLHLRPKYDSRVLVLRRLDGDEVTFDRRISYAEGRLRSTLEALAAVQEDITADNADEALEPVVAAAG